MRTQQQQQDTSRVVALAISAAGLVLSMLSAYAVGSRAGQEQAIENARMIATLQQQVRTLETNHEHVAALLQAQLTVTGRIEGLLDELRARPRR